MLRLSNSLAEWVDLPRRRDGVGGDVMDTSGIAGRNWKWFSSLALVEIRSVTRNRPLVIAMLGNLLLAPLFLYLLYFRNLAVEPAVMHCATALLLSIPSVNYASFCIGKDGYAFQGYMSGLTIRSYVRWKILCMRTYAALFSLVLLPLAFRAQAVAVLAYCASAVYYVGIGGTIMLFVATRVRGKIDLNASPLVASHHMPLSATLFVMPVTAPLFFVDGGTFWAIGATFGAGFAGLVFSSCVSTIIERSLARMKYDILDL